MKIICFVLLILLAAGIVYGADVKKDRPIDVGVSASVDPNIHKAVYNILEKKGVSCEGLSTKKDGTITVIGADKDLPAINTKEIQDELDAIKAVEDTEAKIQAEIRVMAIKSLQDKGELPKDYKDKK